MTMVSQWLAQPCHYQRFLLCIGGLGGLLYGIDVGIIAGALPYLEASAAARWGLTAQQLGLVVAAVLLGSVLSSLAAGALADRFGRQPVMVLAGALFSLSIPVIALADAYLPLLLGRLLQGISGGLIGVVVPLYLAECLPADQRGRGTGLFQLLLTLGLVLAALLGLLVAQQIDQLAGQAPALVIAAKDRAWRQIFWLSLPPGLLFTAGACLLAESPRWLQQRADRSPVETQGSLLQWQYVAPFLLACTVLALNQASGINSILAYSVTILDQAGLPGALANSGDVLLKLVNALMTVLAVLLVDRKGRKFLLTLGSAGMALALLAAGLLFAGQESGQQDVRPVLAQAAQGRSLQLDGAQLAALAPAGDWQLTLAYSYGPYKATRQLRGTDGRLAGDTLTIAPPAQLEGDSVIGAAFRRLHLNPFPDLAQAQQAPLVLEWATLGSLPAQRHGWLMLGCLLLFIASFAVGPGVCVWLALSELMPTRIRSNGMSVALLINQFVSTAIAAVFLPTVVQFGYATMFYSWAVCALLYFLVAALLLPETRGKTLEEISLHFRPARNEPARAARSGRVPE